MAKIIIMMILNIGEETDREDDLDRNHDDHDHEDNDADQQDDYKMIIMVIMNVGEETVRGLKDTIQLD